MTATSQIADRDVDLDAAATTGGRLMSLRTGLTRIIAVTLGLMFVAMPAAIAIDEGLLKVLDRGDPGQVHEVAAMTGLLLVVGLGMLGFTRVRRRLAAQHAEDGARRASWQNS